MQSGTNHRWWVLALALLTLLPAFVSNAEESALITDSPWGPTLDPIVAVEPDLWWAQEWAPALIGDFFYGYPAGARGALAADRLVAIANDLDVPAPLPPAGAPLTITEAPPVGIYQTSVTSVQQLQGLLRAGTPLPPATLAGVVPDNATMTSAITVAQIQTLLASTPGVAYDIVPLVPPPASYATAVDGVFQARYGNLGTTTYDGPASGAMLQGGADTLPGQDFDAFYFYAYNLAINVHSPSAGLGAVGRLKAGDGNSPLPRNRAYFRYGLFDGVPTGYGGETLNRFVPGFEWTLFNGLGSLELRIPFAAAVDSDVTIGPTGITNADGFEFGNLAAYAKLLLYRTARIAISGGIGMTTPTARDVRVRLADGTELLRVYNHAAHLQPFFAALYTPSDRWFVQGFYQLDIAANGNPVSLNRGAGLQRIGRLNDSTFLCVDMGMGYWLRRPGSMSRIGFAPVVELHYNASLQPADHVRVGPVRVGNLGQDVEAMNVTVGSTFTCGDATNLSFGYVVPLGNTQDRQLNGGLRVLLDYVPGRRR